jgi:hypothetical protein
MSERVERYARAMAEQDGEALAELRHEEYECYYPQSGERFRSHEKWVLAHRDYADNFDTPVPEPDIIKGGERKAEVVRTASPRFMLPTPVVQVSDTGDLVTLEGHGEWPDGKSYCWVSILEYRDHLVWRETQYFAERFDPPSWRSEFVELDPDRRG